MPKTCALIVLATISLVASSLVNAAGTITGELKKWHKVTITFDGPSTNEKANPNPFTDYRLNVTFKNASKTYVVPGYYAADGDAAETSADSGNKWRVHFAPDATGTWNYTVSFKKGANIAVSTDAGTSAEHFDGETGSFTIAESDKTGRDNRAKGRLQYVGEHFLKFADSGEWFLKGGADAPENLLNYKDIDGETNSRSKEWNPHEKDWNTGDPTWQSGKGKGLIGAINYLASKGMNVFSFSTFGGDDHAVYPWLSYTDYTHLDCSKLDQWEIIFAHGDSKGMYLHFKTQEQENDQKLDGGAVGTNRKLYYRELIARFGHHLALNWNLGEENTQTDQQRKDMAQYFYDTDPYHHNIVVHTYPGDHDKVYTPLLGDKSKLTGTSIQTGWNNVHNATKKWITESANAGKKWIVANDEQGSANIGVPPDGNSDQPARRKEVLWGNYIAGGAGVEYYFGYSLAHSDLTCEDWRSRDQMWTWTKHAMDFFNNNLPFWQMKHDDAKASGSDNWCLAKDGDIYAVYLKNGGTTSLDLSGSSGTFEVSWFDPRNGGALKDGSVTEITGGSSVSLGNAPDNTSQDWAVLVKRKGYTAAGNSHLPNSISDIEISLKSGFIKANLPRGNWERANLYSAEGRLIAVYPIAAKSSVTLATPYASRVLLLKIIGKDKTIIKPLFIK
jgi:hypothetical protein